MLEYIEKSSLKIKGNLTQYSLKDLFLLKNGILSLLWLYILLLPFDTEKWKMIVHIYRNIDSNAFPFKQTVFSQQ